MMSLYADLVRKAADQYRAQLDAIYSRQQIIHHADHAVGLLLKAGLQARAQAGEDYVPYIVLRLAEDLRPLQSTVLVYVCNVLGCQVEPDTDYGGPGRYQIRPHEDEPGPDSLRLLVEDA
ncbi:hypothetical protein CXB49_15750 [Chromobacterium sp. ATCC 53434]|nr:hypothetical protein CXB49_15750 [Chromobacterium sp. ATCC 53434]